MRKQKGFIQNFIIPGIILIGVVIAGIAMLASNSGGSDTSNEKASMLANSVVGMGLTVSGAIQRAEADGTKIGVDGEQKGLASGANGFNGDTNLVTGKYLTALPSAPQGLTVGDGTTFPYIGYVLNLTPVYDVDDNEIGTEAEDDFVLIDLGDDAMAQLVCRRINNKVVGTPSSDDSGQADIYVNSLITKVKNQTEGCGIAHGGAFDGHYGYFKVVNAK